MIGGGVAGLVAAKVLKQDGFGVTVFEKESALGGVWAESRAYPGLRTNNPRETYSFSDFAYTETADEFPAAGQVRDYLEAYAAHFGLGQCLRLSTEVVSVRRAPGGGPRFEVDVRPRGGLASESRRFDYVVVCNGVFSEPYLPRIEGQSAFAGEVLHSSRLRDPKGLAGKHVVVVGAGKSALDCATAAARTAASATLLFRKPHWMLPRYFGRARVDRVLFTRLSELLLPAYHRTTRAEAVLRKSGLPLMPLLWLQRRLLRRRVARLTGMPRTMVPRKPLHAEIPTLGIGAQFYEALRQGHVHARRGRIAAFSGARAVRLESGERMPADVVVFATGWRQGVSFLDAGLQREVRDDDGGFRLYRHILPPGERRMGFIGYAASTNSPLSSEVAAHWLSQCFLGELALPEPGDMQREINRVRRWAAGVFPGHAEGYFIGAYVAHYIDELMRDMGLPPRRTGSFFREHLGPVWAERYRGLAAERARRQPASTGYHGRAHSSSSV